MFQQLVPKSLATSMRSKVHLSDFANLSRDCVEPHRTNNLSVFSDQHIEGAAFTEVLVLYIVKVGIGALWIGREPIFSEHAKYKAFDSGAVFVGGGA